MKDILRDLGQRYRTKEQMEERRDRKIFEDPVYLHLDAAQFTIGVEMPTCVMPTRDEIVEVHAFGGRAYMLVNVAEYGSIPETEGMLFITGRRVRGG